MARVIIELDNGERFSPDEVDYLIVYGDGSAKVVFKQAYHDIGVIAQTYASSADICAITLGAADLAEFMMKWLNYGKQLHEE